jgi:CheY-like chemotaxis protein
LLGSKNEEGREFAMPRILVVEDELNIRLLVVTLLQQKSYEVVEAGSGLEAFTILRRDSNFNVIITDLRLPKTDVLNYIDQLKQEFSHIPLMIMSAHITSAWAADAVRQSVAFVAKPFTRQQFVDCVEHVLTRGKTVGAAS